MTAEERATIIIDTYFRVAPKPVSLRGAITDAIQLAEAAATKAERERCQAVCERERLEYLASAARWSAAGNAYYSAQETNGAEICAGIAAALDP